MSSGTLFQVLVNLIFAAGFVAIWIRLNKPAKDDPRLSRGLQLLQSKIAILEDLSDQVERQVQQVAQLMEVKTRDLQRHIEKSDDQIRQIETATSKSLEVARIFQDRIPHEEMVDRKSTLKYVKAARLANKGLSIEEIAEQVDLSRGELEFVAKVNRDNLQFSEEDLPEWAKLAGGTEFLEEAEAAESRGPVLENTVAEPQPLLRVNDRSTGSAATSAAGRAGSFSGVNSDRNPDRISSGNSDRNSMEPLDQLGRKFREAFEQGGHFAGDLSAESAPSSPAPQPGSLAGPVRPLDRQAGQALQKNASFMNESAGFDPRALGSEANIRPAHLGTSHSMAGYNLPEQPPRLEMPAGSAAPKEPVAFNRAAALASKNAGERLIQRVVFPKLDP